MRKTSSWWCGVLLSSVVACSGAASQSTAPNAGPEAFDPKAERFQGKGLTVRRPTAWSFVAPDAAAGKDTVVVLVGPAAEFKIGPMVALSKRPLTAEDRLLVPEELIKVAGTGLVQTFEGYSEIVGPAEAMLAGHKGTLVKATYDEDLPDGSAIRRRAHAYAVLTGDEIWFVRCFLPAGDAFDDDVSAVLASIAFEAR